MTSQLPKTAAEYVGAINGGNAAGFIALFADDAVVDDAGREFRGRSAIRDWSDREVFGAQVTLDVLDATGHASETVLTTKVDGNFDRTGLPDPVIITQRIAVVGGKIVALTCRLAEQGAKA
jgi:hypothetical protein